jgi:hypothetical protein
MNKSCIGHGILSHIPGKNTYCQMLNGSLALTYQAFCCILDNKKIQPNL